MDDDNYDGIIIACVRWLSMLIAIDLIAFLIYEIKKGTRLSTLQ
jgi:hypothetical protein